MKKIGPGLLVAAAGIGAGDMILGIQIGLDFKWVFVLAVLLAAVLKYVITEGIAKYQLAKGRTIIEFWNENIPIWLRLVFILFFVIWSFMVGAALLSACGLAANSLLPFLSKEYWAIIHSMMAFALIYFGRYQVLESITKVLILFLFIVLIPTAIILIFNSPEVASTRIHLNAYDTPTLIMGIFGGVGGSVTMLSYTYWVEEKKWEKTILLKNIRFDLRISYLITALFVIAIMLISSAVELGSNQSGSALILGISEVIGNLLGNTGALLFKLCFWGVVFSSVITVWSGVPYLFSDFYKGFVQKKTTSNDSITHSKVYLLFLAFISLAPLLLTFLQSTVKNVINYTLISSFFVVGISITLLIINSKKEIGNLGNSPISKAILYLCVFLFAGLLIWQGFHS